MEYQKLSYLSIKQLTALFNVKESWIRRQIFLNKIPYKKMGGLVRFQVSEIEEWMQSKASKGNQGE